MPDDQQGLAALAGMDNHWIDYGMHEASWSCNEESEFCSNCGREMVLSVEPTGMSSRTTGRPTFARYHSCPTWVEGWRTRYRFTRFWFTPGMGHDSHDADNPLSGRGYR
jgi:hypothetical protein